MPYPFAHVAAAVPLCALLGKRSVPSALALGSIVPDLWYFVPVVEREQAHSVTGLLWFCLPVSLFLYFAFHLLFKQPLLHIMPGRIACRVRPWTCPALPPAPWHAVLVSLVVGALVHLAWDALTHPTFPLLEQRIFLAGERAVYVHQILQHSSTLLGTAFLAWWAWTKLRVRRREAMVTTIPAPVRAAAVAMLLAAPAAAFLLIVLTAWPSQGADLPTIRALLRAAATTAASVLGLGFVAYCVLWKLRVEASSDGRNRKK